MNYSYKKDTVAMILRLNSYEKPIEIVFEDETGEREE